MDVNQLSQLRGEVPAQVVGLIDWSKPIESKPSRLGNGLLRVTCTSGELAFLKIAKDELRDEISRETQRLLWLNVRLGSPQVLVDAEAESSWLLISNVDGAPSYLAVNTLGAVAVVELLAQTLAEIHAIDASTCPWAETWDAELADAQQRLGTGRVNIDRLVASIKRQPEAALSWLQNRGAPKGPRVVTHGDYCMPNVLIDAHKSVGVIDWSQAGLAHPARDLASVKTTLQINELTQHTTTFYRLYCEATGRDIDHEAIETYLVLAEFF